LRWLPDWLPDRGSCLFSVSLGSCPGRPLLHGSLIACSCLTSVLWCHTPRSHVRPLRTPEAAVLLFADPQKEVSTFILGPPTRCMATPDFLIGSSYDQQMQNQEKHLSRGALHKQKTSTIRKPQRVLCRDFHAPCCRYGKTSGGLLPIYGVGQQS